MEFHPEKSSVLTVSRKKKPIKWDYILHGHVLKHETSMKYLGCTITNELDWGEHINNITSKASRSLGFLHRNLHIGSKSIKQPAYRTLVRPNQNMPLQYGTHIIRNILTKLKKYKGGLRDTSPSATETDQVSQI